MNKEKKKKKEFLKRNRCIILRQKENCERTCV